MRTLILYTSSAGSTKAYAEEIALGMGTEAMEFNKKKFRKMNLDDYDTIVYGGWVKGSQIQGVDDFLSRWEEMEKKNVILFSCGMSAVYKEVRDNLISANLLDLYHLRFYPLRGSFDYNKLNFRDKMMMKLGLQQALAMGKGEDKDNNFLQQALQQPFVYKDTEGVNRILSVLHRLASEQNA